MKDVLFSDALLLWLYDRVAEAEDAIPRLRRFVLDLAVRGKLVPQESGDEPASVLLERIEKEKARLVKAGEIKREKEPSYGKFDALTGGLPSGWTLSALSQIAACLDYRRIPINGGERDKRNEGKDQTELFPYFGATQQQGWIDEYIFDADLVLLGEDGVPFHDPLRQKAYRVSGKSWVNNHAHVFLPILVSPEYVTNFLNVFDYAGRVVGATRAKLNQAQAVTIPVPLPPLAEQHRIVAKVGELMALLDRLEAARAVWEETRTRLTAATLSRLTEAGTDTPTSARFALQTLPALTTRPDQIKTLRQTILNLAVRGKLVEQDVRDAPAHAELLQIAKRKEASNLRRPKKVPPITQDEQWASTPTGWAWTRWDYITDWITYGFTRPMEHHRSGIPIVTGKNVINGKIDYSTAHFASRAAFDRLNDKDKPQPGDVLITKDGSIGRTAGVREDHGDFCINQSVAVLWLRSCHLSREYIQLVLDSPQTQQELQARTAGVAIKHLSITDLGMMVWPVPPLAEQHRIVAKVEELMSLCDRLERALQDASTTRARLLDATLRDALAGAVEVAR